MLLCENNWSQISNDLIKLHMSPNLITNHQAQAEDTDCASIHSFSFITYPLEGHRGARANLS